MKYMNYEQRVNLQKKLKDFTDDEICELLDCVLFKENAERQERKTQQRLDELFR